MTPRLTHTRPHNESPYILFQFSFWYICIDWTDFCIGVEFERRFCLGFLLLWVESFWVILTVRFYIDRSLDVMD